jgi:hypothetical protein
VLDAGLVSAAQHVEHYEIAGYGSVRTWARQLGFDNQATLLQQTLDEEKKTDSLLTRLAEQSVNADAQSETEVSRRTAGVADAPARPAVSRARSEKRPRPSPGR